MGYHGGVNNLYSLLLKFSSTIIIHIKPFFVYSFCGHLAFLCYLHESWLDFHILLYSYLGYLSGNPEVESCIPWTATFVIMSLCTVSAEARGDKVQNLSIVLEDRKLTFSVRQS